jgi:hypothetical protein
MPSDEEKQRPCLFVSIWRKRNMHKLGETLNPEFLPQTALPDNHVFAAAAPFSRPAVL